MLTGDTSGRPVHHKLRPFRPKVIALSLVEETNGGLTLSQMRCARGQNQAITMY